MKKYAMILSNEVFNIALWDGVTPWNPGDQFTLVDVTHTQCDIGYLYDNGQFSAPQPKETE